MSGSFPPTMRAWSLMTSLCYLAGAAQFVWHKPASCRTRLSSRVGDLSGRGRAEGLSVTLPLRPLNRVDRCMPLTWRIAGSDERASTGSMTGQMISTTSSGVAD